MLFTAHHKKILNAAIGLQKKCKENNFDDASLLELKKLIDENKKDFHYIDSMYYGHDLFEPEYKINLHDHDKE